jgi:CRP/FNR family cyclic AMP-dependent transcriptional regulator
VTAVAANIPLAPTRRDGLSQVQRRLETLGTETELMTGDTLDAGIAARSLGFVLCGQLTMTWQDGDDESTIGMLLPGDWLGENNLLLGASPPKLTYRASRFTRLLTLPPKRLHALLDGDLAALKSALERELSQSAARRWAQLAERLHQCIYVTTDDLVIEALQEAASWPSAMSHPDGTLVKVPRDVLAQRVGCTRVTISRALSRLVDAGQVRLEGRRILLIGRQGRGGAA